TEAAWPGNVRELAHAIEAAAIRAAWESVEQIEGRHVFPDTADIAVEPAPEEGLTLQEATRRFQKRYLAQALDGAGWNVTESARKLDVARAHIYNLIRAFGLKRPR